MELDCPNSAYDTFMKLYTNIFNTAFPLRENVTPKKYKKHSNWITKGLVHSSNHKHKLLLKN